MSTEHDPSAPGTTTAGLRAAVDANPLWYHTLDLRGVTTPGWFDLRPVVDRIPWPDVRGRRCLDVATYDGFFAFELERRGAAEVVAIDIASHEQWDWPLSERGRGAAYLNAVAGRKGHGFEIAAEALQSRVERRFLSVYDLDPASVGMFDVVVCGSLLLHLRDPFAALEAIRSVCAGQFLSVEAIDLRLTALGRRSTYMRLNGNDSQWMVPNRAAHARMLDLCAFDVQVTPRPFATPFGVAHPPARSSMAARAVRLAFGGRGVPTQALLATPRQLID